MPSKTKIVVASSFFFFPSSNITTSVGDGNGKCCRECSIISLYNHSYSSRYDVTMGFLSPISFFAKLDVAFY